MMFHYSNIFKYSSVSLSTMGVNNIWKAAAIKTRLMSTQKWDQCFFLRRVAFFGFGHLYTYINNNMIICVYIYIFISTNTQILNAAGLRSILVGFLGDKCRSNSSPMIWV